MNNTKIFALSVILLIIGGLNWGLIGIFNFDFIASLLGHMSILSRLVYILVGVSAVAAAITVPKKD
jgi:uncharacterized protein